MDGTVPVDARPCLPTVLTKEEEEKLCKYCMDMCDMGYGMNVEDARTVAFCITESSGRVHPFKSGKAGRDWYWFYVNVFYPHPAKRRSPITHVGR